MDQGKAAQQDDFYCITASFVTGTNVLTHGTTVVVTKHISQRGDFIIIKSNMDCRTAAASTNQATPYGTVLLRDLAYQTQLMDVAAPLTCMFGTGQNPAVWPQAHRIPGNADFEITVANLESSTDYDLRLTFIGKLQWVYKDQGQSNV